jgi:phage terminase large subunit-like protein
VERPNVVRDSSLNESGTELLGEQLLGVAGAALWVAEDKLAIALEGRLSVVVLEHGDEGVLECIDKVRELAGQHNVREVVFDPWRFGQGAQELERERVPVTAFPQTDVRMIPASDRLYRAIVEKRLTLPDDEELRQHASAAIAKHSRRGWRIDKANRADTVDAIIALCMALERAEFKPEPVELLGWL